MAGFTTIAVATSLGISAASAGASFVQAGKQRDAARKASDEAAEAIADAKKELSVNYLEGLSINKEAYELEREALLSSGAQVLQTAREGERGAGEAAGRVALGMQAGQAGQRIGMNNELMEIQKAAAKEGSALATKRANLNLGEAKGFEMEAADARAARVAANQAGVNSLLSLAQGAMKIPGLYGNVDPLTIDDAALQKQLQPGVNSLDASIDPMQDAMINKSMFPEYDIFGNRSDQNFFTV